MKVVFVAPYALPFRAGGFESQVYHIFSELRSLGVDVVWHNLENSNLDGVDILQVMATDPSMLPLIRNAKNKGVKIIMTPMQGSRAKTNSHYKRCLFLSRIPQFCVGHKLNYETIRSADYFTPLCTYEADRLVDVYGVNKNSVSIIPNGLEESYLNDKVTEIELPFKDYLLAVGRIEKNKNQKTLIEVAKILNKKVILVGVAGNNNDEYLEECKIIANDNIYFWGAERDPYVMKYLYRNAKLTVIPSLSEMVPLVVFESLSQLTPVVCTNRCGISNDKIPGVLFSDISKKALINSIPVMLDFNRQLITQQGVCSWKDVAKMYKSVYNIALNNGIIR